MRIFLFFLLLLASQTLLHGQAVNQIIIGTIDSLQSEILGEQRKVWVYVPNGGDQDICSKQKYPVVYLLDGPGHFLSVVGMIHQLSTTNGNTLCPEMIVVGIENTVRSRDLTPTETSEGPLAENSGGGENFIAFLEKELMPYVEAHYPTQPYRMLIGHSLGGLTAMHILLHHPDLFNAYISIDPSMWWDDRHLLSEAGDLLKEKDFTGKSLYLGIANTMPADMSLKKLKKDTSEATNHQRSILDLSKLLDKNPQNGLRYRYKYYQDDDHGSVPLITEYDALRFIFDFFSFEIDLEAFNDTTKMVGDDIEDHFNNVSEKMGYTVHPPENMVNSLGYMAMRNENMQQAEYFFKMNVSHYPESFNVYDSLGDYYVAMEDKENAIQSFKQALAIRENVFSRNKLEGLLKH